LREAVIDPQLDPTMTDAERDHLKSDLLSSQMEVARLRAAVSGKSDRTEAFDPPMGEQIKATQEQLNRLEACPGLSRD
jgi:membrane fusion protein, hemolysin D